MSATTTNRRPLGIWHRPDADWGWGLGPTGARAALIALTLFILAFVPAQHRLRNVLIVAVVGVLVVGPFAWRDEWDRHGYKRASSRLRWWWHRSTGRTVTEGPWLSEAPVEQSGLPGLLAQSSITDHLSWETGLRWGVLHHPPSRSAGVVIECEPAGDALTDPDDLAGYHSAWASWLDDMADEPGLVAIQVVAEAAPSVTPIGIDGANPQAVELLADLVDATEGQTVVRTWVAVHWGSKHAETGPELSARVQRLCDSLTEAGAGHATPLTKAGIARVWAGMHDPDRRDSLARHGGDLDLAAAGPVVADEHRRALQLGDWQGVSLTVGRPLEGVPTTAALARLARGVDHAAAVRWAIHYRPVSASEAAGWARRVRRAIDTRMALKGPDRATIADEVDNEDKTVTVKALARGTTLTRLGITVTLTLHSDLNRSTPVEIVRGLVAPLSAHLRIMDGAHAASWTATLPGGVPLPAALQPSEGLR